MIPLATAKEMAETDARAAAAGVPVPVLMENAGRAVAEAIRARREVAGRKVVVLAGKGNNGGDGRVAARHLAAAGASVRVFGPLPGDDGPWPSEDAVKEAAAADVVVDALLGTGARVPLTGAWAEAVASLSERIARRGDTPFVVAVDIPTGRPADSGAAQGPWIPSDLVVTFAAGKPGLYLEPAAGEIGEVVVAPIGMPEAALAPLFRAVLERADLSAGIPLRPRTAHKGDARLALLGGGAGTTGAIALAAEGAYGIGVGYLHLLVPGGTDAIYASLLPEAVRVALPEREGVVAGLTDAAREVLARAHAVVVGPGLGLGDHLVVVLREVLAVAGSRAGRAAVVLDGDAITILAGNPTIRRVAKAPLVLTPHPGEAARLLGRSAGEIEADRIAAAEAIAAKYEAVCVLKGRPTVVACDARTAGEASGGRPPIRTVVVPFGNERLATAGAGDVLAGVLGALLCRAPFAPREVRCGEAGERTVPDLLLRAAVAAALHGLAAEAAPHSPFGLRMRDLPRFIAAAAAEAAGRGRRPLR